MLIVISKMYFHNDCLFFAKIVSSSGNVLVVLRIKHICNTAHHKSLISGLFHLSKRSQRDNSSEYQKRTIFPENIEFSGISLYSDKSIRHHKNTQKSDGN